MRIGLCLGVLRQAHSFILLNLCKGVSFFMNKIFKVIWNRTTQSLVVTSELAKGAVKASCENNNQENKTSFGRIFKLSAIAIALTGAINYANAAYTENGFAKADSIAISGNAGKKANAIGIGPSTDTGNIAIGTDSAAQATSDASTRHPVEPRCGEYLALRRHSRLRQSPLHDMWT